MFEKENLLKRILYYPKYRATRRSVDTRNLFARCGVFVRLLRKRRRGTHKRANDAIEARDRVRNGGLRASTGCLTNPCSLWLRKPCRRAAAALHCRLTTGLKRDLSPRAPNMRARLLARFPASGPFPWISATIIGIVLRHAVRRHLARGARTR